MNRYGIWPPMPMATPGLPSFHAVMNDGPSWASNNNMGWDGVRSTVDAGRRSRPVLYYSCNKGRSQTLESATYICTVSRGDPSVHRATKSNSFPFHVATYLAGNIVRTSGHFSC
jgi:hypothetical protein